MLIVVAALKWKLLVQEGLPNSTIENFKAKFDPKKNPHESFSREKKRVIFALASQDPWQNLAAHLLLDLGARVQDIAALTWAQVTVVSEGERKDTGKVELAAQKTTARTGVLTRETMVILATRKEELGVDWKSKERVMGYSNTDSLRLRISKYFKRHDLHLHTHSFRKSCITDLYEKTGHNLMAVKNYIGHLSINSTQGYIDKQVTVAENAILGEEEEEEVLPKQKRQKV
jgi:integrase